MYWQAPKITTSTKNGKGLKNNCESETITNLLCLNSILLFYIFNLAMEILNIPYLSQHEIIRRVNHCHA